MLQNTWRRLPGWLHSSVACPDCGGNLDFQDTRILCATCRAAFPQIDERVIDLRSRDTLSRAPDDWSRRQRVMTRGYQDLLEDRDHSILAYRSDYGPLAPVLQHYQGRIVDLGGANGIARHWLPADVQYVLVEPTVDWLDMRWESLADVFPCLRTSPPFVRGVGERLPFVDDSFDGALLLWSLNHAIRPRDVLREAARVLKPGGRLLVVLEDMPPSWHDYRAGQHPDALSQGRGWLALKMLKWTIIGYPLQADHIRVRESDLRAAKSLVIRTRTWRGAYLTYELEKAAC